MPQKVNLDFFIKNLKIKTDLNSFKLTNPLAKNQFQRMPGLQLNYFVNKDNLNFHFDMDFAYFNKGGAFRNDDKQNLLRISLKPEISHAFTKNNYLLKAKLSFNFSHEDFNNQSSSKFLPILDLEQSLKFFKKTESS